MSKLQTAVFAFGVGCFLSAVICNYILSKNRKTESEPNKTIPAPSENEMKWHVVHIRDDLGLICTMLVVANGLLTAIAALLIFNK